MNDLNLADIQPAPVVKQKQNKDNSPFWVVGAFTVLALVLLSFLFLRGCDFTPNPGPGPDPGPDVDGVHVMIIEDVEEHRNLTAAQQGIFTSPELIEWGDKHCQKYSDPEFTAFLKVDKDDDLGQFPKIIKDLKDYTMDKYPGVPSIGILTPKGFDAQRLPEDKDRTLQLLESVL